MASLVAVVAVALAVPLATIVANDQRAVFVSTLQVDTLTTAARLAALPAVGWSAVADEVAARTGARVVIVRPDLTLAADSDRSSLDRRFDRPEVQAALAGSLTSNVRQSSTLGEALRYVAAPVVQGPGVVAAVRLTLPESLVTDQVRTTERWLVVFVVTVVVAAGLVAWLLARSISAPLRRLAKVAEALPDDLSLRGDETHGPAEVRAVARALNRTGSRLAGILRRAERVAADASHHLRTPLTGVRLRLEAIEDLSEQEVVVREAQAATQEVDRLTRRIEQVLELARADVAGAPATPQEVSRIVVDRVEAAAGMFDEQGVALESDVEPGLVVVAASGVVERVVDELLANALRYARTAVSIVVRSQPHGVSLVVEDDGPGIPPAERVSVFEPFVRGSRAKPGGSGLGLALVREAVTGLGGSVTAAETNSGGLRVAVRLPGAGQTSRPMPE